MRLITVLFIALLGSAALGATSKPNIVIILADDLGYGDLSIQGHPLIRTPHIDQLAREGQRWTSFYASAPMCGPSRVALMTGRLPIRITGSEKNEWIALPDTEVTMGEMLKKEGYSTAYIGKWGLAMAQFDYPGSHPNDQGFDYFFGMIGSNDYPLREGMTRTYENIKTATSNDFPIPLYRQQQVIEKPVHQPTLTKRYTEESVGWIRDHRDKPFFLFLAHSMPHVPLFRSKAFEGHSAAGRYGDVVEELDWSVGEVVEALRELGIAENTLVFFSSDNGPWRTYRDLGGTSGPFRDGKITAWEGGFRVPAIFWWPGKIMPAVVNDIGSNVDLMRTVATMVGLALPREKVFDSIDLSPALLLGRKSARREWIFYGALGDLWAVRVDNYKLVFRSWDSLGVDTGENQHGYSNLKLHSPPLLFDLDTDISESWSLTHSDPGVLKRLQQAVERHRSSLKGNSPSRP